MTPAHRGVGSRRRVQLTEDTMVIGGGVVTLILVLIIRILIF